MLRPHTFAQLQPFSYTLVTFARRCYKLTDNKNSFRAILTELQARGVILEFYINFQSKTMLDARLYFLSQYSISNNMPIVAMRRVKAPIEATNRGLVSGFFLKTATRSAKLSAFLKRNSRLQYYSSAVRLEIRGKKVEDVARDGSTDG